MKNDELNLICKIGFYSISLLELLVILLLFLIFSDCRAAFAQGISPPLKSGESRIILARLRWDDKMMGTLLEVNFLDLNCEVATEKEYRIPVFFGGQLVFSEGNSLYFLMEKNGGSHGMASSLVKFDLDTGRQIFEEYLCHRLVGIEGSTRIHFSRNRKQLLIYNDWHQSHQKIKLLDLKTHNSEEIVFPAFGTDFDISKKGFICFLPLKSKNLYGSSYSSLYPIFLNLGIAKLNGKNLRKIEKRYLIKNYPLYFPVISSYEYYFKRSEERFSIQGSLRKPHKAFSPEGDRLAFAGCREFPFFVNLYCVDLNSGKINRLLHLDDFNGNGDINPEWSEHGIVVISGNKIYTNCKDLIDKLKRPVSVNNRSLKMAFLLDLIVHQPSMPVFSLPLLLSEILEQFGDQSRNFVEINIPSGIQNLREGKISPDGNYLMFFGTKFTESTGFSEKDFFDLHDFARKLYLSKDVKVRRIYSMLSDGCKLNVDRQLYGIESNKRNEEQLIGELNRLLKRQNLFDRESFSMISLNDEVKLLTTRGMANLMEEEVQKVNRMIMESTFPDDIARAQYLYVINLKTGEIQDKKLGNFRNNEFHGGWMNGKNLSIIRSY